MDDKVFENGKVRGRLYGRVWLCRSLLAAGLLALVWLGRGGALDIHSAADLAFLYIIADAAVIDAKTMTIPNRHVGAAVMISFVSFLQEGRAGLLRDHFLGMLCLSLPFFLLAVLLPGRIGGGDIKLLAAAGLYMGAGPVSRAFLTAAVLAGAGSLIMLLLGKMKIKDRIPMGPFLFAGILIVFLAGGRQAGTGGLSWQGF